MLSIKYKSALMLALLAFAALACNASLAAGQADLAQSRLQSAGDAVAQAYLAVSDAEAAGANVTSLVARLNVAVQALVDATNSYRAGDSDAALAGADAALPLAQLVASDAYDAKQAALVSEGNALWSAVALSVVGAAVFLAVLFMVWRWFKQRYINNMLKAKPEVSSP